VTDLRPTLDDVTYADFVARARAAIPVLAPDWTDHNPSDPGIVLVELFAWLAEMLVYRTDQLPDDHVRAFLTLLGGPPPGDVDDLDTAVTHTIAQLRHRWRAVTAADLEELALEDWPRSPEAAARADIGTIRRARAVAARNLEATGGARQVDAPGHLSLVIVPASDDPAPQPTPELCTALQDWLEPRRLLGARHHVVGPDYVDVAIAARLVLHESFAPTATASSGILTTAAIEADTRRIAVQAVKDHFHPLSGAGGSGWPFGRSVFLSELYQLLDGLPGVDYVDDVRFVRPSPERAIGSSGQRPAGTGTGEEVAGIWLDEHELVRIAVVDDAADPDHLVVVSPQRGGGRS
jgi:hypothetical protein